MDWKIGEIRQINGEWYQCLEDTNDCHCDDCELEGVVDCYKIVCRSDERIDNKNVYFKKLEKVGEPIIYMNKTFQRLKTLDNYCCKYCYFGNQACNSEICGQESFLVEIKNIKEDIKKDMKEDMKENIKENIKGDIEEKILNLKPFDIEKAKEGKPVCTRDGRSARIVCFDRIGISRLPIIALVKNGEHEDVYFYHNNGRDNGNEEKDYDLLMKPIIKTGWINVHKTNGLYETEEDAKKNQLNDDFIAVKVEFEV